jgi:hypothetical protein
MHDVARRTQQASALCEQLKPFQTLFLDQISFEHRDGFAAFYALIKQQRPAYYAVWQTLKNALAAECDQVANTKAGLESGITSPDSVTAKAELFEKEKAKIRGELTRALYGATEFDGAAQGSGIAQGYVKYDTVHFFTTHPSFIRIFSPEVLSTFEKIQYHYITFKRRALTEELYQILSDSTLAASTHPTHKTQLKYLTQSYEIGDPRVANLGYIKIILRLFYQEKYKPHFTAMIDLVNSDYSREVIIRTINYLLKQNSSLAEYLADSVNLGSLRIMSSKLRHDFHTMGANTLKATDFVEQAGALAAFDCIRQFLAKLHKSESVVRLDTYIQRIQKLLQTETINALPTQAEKTAFVNTLDYQIILIDILTHNTTLFAFAQDHTQAIAEMQQAEAAALAAGSVSRPPKRRANENAEKPNFLRELDESSPSGTSKNPAKRAAASGNYEPGIPKAPRRLLPSR